MDKVGKNLLRRFERLGYKKTTCRRVKDGYEFSHSDDSLTKVFVIKGVKTLTGKQIADYDSEYKDSQINCTLLVPKMPKMPKSWPENIEILPLIMFQFDPLEYHLQPAITLLADSDPSPGGDNIPLILQTDVISRYFRANPGQILKYKSFSSLTGLVTTYRKVVAVY